MRRPRFRATAVFRLAIICCLSFAAVSQAKDLRIEGQVFIATKDGENIKLALVPVGLYPAQQMRDYIAAKDAANAVRAPKMQALSKEAEQLAAEAHGIERVAFKAHLDDYNDEKADAVYQRAEKLAQETRETVADWGRVIYYLRSGLYYFGSLPSAAASAKTDADGKFVLSVPSKGNWVLAAYGKRRAGEDQEFYYWLVKVSVTEEKTSVMLANDNLLDSGAADSLMKGFCDDDFASRGGDLLPKADKFVAEADEKAANEKMAAKELEDQERAANLQRLVKESQSRAVKKHPDLGKAGSALNKQFVERYKTLQAEKSPRLQEPDWPEKLADECAAAP